MAKRIFGIALLTTALLATPAKAQIYGVFDMGALTNTLSVDAVTQSERARAAGENAEGENFSNEAASNTDRQPSDTPTSPIPNTASIEALSFSPSLDLRRANLAQFVERRRALDPAAAAQLETIFAQGDVIEAVAPALAEYGLRTNNLADAYAAWWMTAWQIWAGDTSEGSLAQATGVKNQAAIAILSTPALANATDAQKQSWAEEFLVEAMIFSAALDHMKTEPSQPALKAHMAQLAQSMGMDFTTMTLTDDGFILNDT